MKIVNIIGGLGNQMFQYAFALALKAKYPCEDVKISIHAFNGYLLHNGFELHRIFNSTLPIANIKDLLRLAYPFFNHRSWQLMKKTFPIRKSMIVENKDMDFVETNDKFDRDLYFEGFWQSEKYYSECRNLILNAFQFSDPEQNSKNEILIRQIKQSNAVSIHVRRGDYLKISVASGICTEEYYIKAIKLIVEKCSPDFFVIFSDDIDWCKKHFEFLSMTGKVTFVDWNYGDESYRDMQLMSLCNHNIIANSSFSWWGAWLNSNPQKLVIAPSRWMNSSGCQHVLPSDWIKIKV